MECPSNAYLPADIVRQILSRLPAKILSRFKCVCKAWYTLIESQSFVNDHFFCESNQGQLLIFDQLKYDMMGEVNGIFCVRHSSGTMCLLNPALRQFKPIPFLSFWCRNSNFWAFGLDPLSGYYKVVSIKKNEKFYPSPIVHVYSSGSDSWRLLENVDILRPFQRASKSSTNLNGVCYWVMMYRNNDYDVLAFDMSSEKFRMIRIPDVIRQRGLGLEFELKLVVYGDSIVMLSFSKSFRRSDKFVDMWVLENDGMWTKSLTFGPFEELRAPLGFWKNNELVLEYNYTTVLTLCNIFTRELRYVKGRGSLLASARYFSPSMYTYKESLVSLKREGKEDKCKLLNIYSDFFMDFFGSLIRSTRMEKYFLS